MSDAITFDATFEGGTRIVRREPVAQLLGFTIPTYGLFKSVITPEHSLSEIEYHHTDFDAIQHILKYHGVSEDLAVSHAA